MNRVLFISAICVGAVYHVSCAKMGPEPLHVICDFRQNHAFTSVQPVGREVAGIWVHSGRLTVDLLLANGKRFSGRAAAIFITKDGENIKSFKMQTDSGTLDQIYDLALKVMSEFELDKKNFNEWYKRRKSNPEDTSWLFETIDNKSP